LLCLEVESEFWVEIVLGLKQCFWVAQRFSAANKGSSSPALAAAFRLDEFLRDSDYRTRPGGAK
jgi:hypothetical protein